MWHEKKGPTRDSNVVVLAWIKSPHRVAGQPGKVLRCIQKRSRDYSRTIPFTGKLSGFGGGDGRWRLVTVYPRLGGPCGVVRVGTREIGNLPIGILLVVVDPGGEEMVLAILSTRKGCLETPVHR